MNKTIIININGIVFHIEEDAYEVLRSYMTEVKRHFAYSAGSDEIVTDIENRIAEMFSERLNDNKQVIELTDVQEATRRMGSVSDFDLQDEEEPLAARGIKSEKKLFRDPDDRFIGGVCSGIGHYFHMEAKWVRLITVFITLLWGTGLVIYVILWIVMPQARTRADKMAMRGEEINLQNFKRNFDEELESVAGSIHNLHEQARPGIDKAQSFLGDLFKYTGDFISKAAVVFVKIIGGLIIMSCAFALFGLVMALIFATGFWTTSNFEAFPINVINPEYRNAIFFSAFILIIIPLIALILFALKVLFNRKVVTKTGSFAMLILWLTGLGMAIFYGSKIGAEFAEDARFEQTVPVKGYPVLYLKQNTAKFFTKDDSLRFHIGDRNIRGRILIDDDDNEIGLATKFDLFIEKSTDGTFSVVKEFSGRGKNYENALQAAQRTTYRFTQTDSLLTFDKYLALSGNGLYRAQKVNVTLRVPEHTRLVIDGDLNSRLHNYNLNDCLPENADWKTPSQWVMGADGLVCDSTSFKAMPK